VTKVSSVTSKSSQIATFLVVYVYLEVSPTKGVQRFGVKGKLAPRYIGPYEVTEKFSTVAYCIRLLDRLAAVHDVFHVSQLKKCEQIPEAQIIEETNAEIEPHLSLVEYLMRILDHKQRQTRRQKVKMYKIQWSHHTEEEATWETDQFLNRQWNMEDPSPLHLDLHLRRRQGFMAGGEFSSCWFSLLALRLCVLSSVWLLHDWFLLSLRFLHCFIWVFFASLVALLGPLWRLLVICGTLMSGNALKMIFTV
jgi:hypothetical protein